VVDTEFKTMQWSINKREKIDKSIRVRDNDVKEQL